MKGVESGRLWRRLWACDAARLSWAGSNKRLPLQQDAGDPKQPVGDPTQGTSIGVTTRPEGGVAAAARGVVQDSHPRPVEHSIAQPDLGGVANRDQAALATALGHRRHAGEGPEGGDQLKPGSVFYYADEFNISWHPTLHAMWGPK